MLGHPPTKKQQAYYNEFFKHDRGKREQVEEGDDEEDQINSDLRMPKPTG